MSSMQTSISSFLSSSFNSSHSNSSTSSEGCSSSSILEDFNSYTSSVCSASSTNTKRERKHKLNDQRGLKESLIWKFYHKEKKNDRIMRAICLHCGISMAPRPTGCMQQHSRKCNKTLLHVEGNKFLHNILFKVPKNQMQYSDSISIIGSHKFKNDMDRAITNLIVGLGIPFSVVDNPLFKRAF